MDSGRHTKLLIGLAVAAAILLVRLFYIQIIDGRYKTDALNNSIVYKTIYPPRGIIYDRNGRVLVGNRICYDILVTPREVRAFDTLALAAALDIEPDYVREKMAYYRKWRTRIGFRSQVFLKQVDAETWLSLAENISQYPGFSGQMRSIRSYPFNAGGNLLGYVSEVDARYIEKHPEYKAGDLCGKTGLEGAREAELRGSKGWNIFWRDSRNRVLSSYKDGAEDLDAVPGSDLHTTIDASLQQYGQYLMEGKIGSVVALEPSTGEILAMVSSPGIDVDVLADISSHYNEIAANPGKPMFNRTVMASYPPGSVFKLVNGLIGLQEGVLTPQTMYPCHSGFYYTTSRKVGCHEHRSPLNFYDAVKMSCNGYFCYVFRSILENPRYENTSEAFDVWRDYVTKFGFGSPLGSDFPSELGGNIPKHETYDRIYGRGHWRFSSIVSLSIGQGEIGVTPLQIANLSAIMANRGWYKIPHIVRDSSGRFTEKHYTGIDEKHFEEAVKGMWLAVNSAPGDGGTATIGAVRGLDICGKTGTAQNPHGDDNSVFICFAPREDPKIAVAVYVENAGFGGTWACPIASLMVERYLTGGISPGREWVEKHATDGYRAAHPVK